MEKREYRRYAALSDERLSAQCDFSAFRATGPGGQGVNTTDSAVRLVHRPTGVTAVAREERSQLRNRHLALEKLRARLAQLGREPRHRKPTKPTKAARRRRLESKRMRSETKRRRRNPPRDE